MKKTRRVIATDFPAPDTIDQEAYRRTFIALRERDEERARRAAQEHPEAEAIPEPVLKPASKVKQAADTAS